MAPALIGFAGGAASGALAGFLLSLFEWWGKDLRDARVTAAGYRPPSDRVFPAYHRPLAVLGAFQGAGLVLALDVPPVWAAVSVFVIPALGLCFLILSALVTLLGVFSSSGPRPDRD